MIRSIWGFIAGLVFGLGLVISGMSNPAKVINFLDIAGKWDPSLLFVLGGASVTTFIGYRLVWGRGSPIIGEAFHLPTRNDVDRKLIVGAVLFGIGWGIGGFCPGPAWTALPLMAKGTMAFFPSMLIGIVGMRWWLQAQAVESA